MIGQQPALVNRICWIFRRKEMCDCVPQRSTVSSLCKCWHNFFECLSFLIENYQSKLDTVSKTDIHRICTQHIIIMMYICYIYTYMYALGRTFFHHLSSPISFLIATKRFLLAEFFVRFFEVVLKFNFSPWLFSMEICPTKCRWFRGSWISCGLISWAQSS